MILQTMDSGDTAWILAASSAVLIMTPGLALFYGGLLRKKNVLNMFALSFVAMFLATITWVLFGYSTVFGKDIGGVIGNPSEYAGLVGVWRSDQLVGTIPLSAFIIFQLVFLMITSAILASPFAERAKFSGFIVFITIWMIVVYNPIAHWVWGGGWLGADGIGAIDFAGGTVVHINSGASALAVALVIGKRIDYQKYEHRPHNIPLVLTGLGLLWFGWLGFNGGSALAADNYAGLAMLNTIISAGSAAFIWIIIEYMDKDKGKPTLIGMATGVLAGLVGITPSAGNVEPWAALLIGAITSIFVYKAISWRNKSPIDETLDAFSCHGVGGLVGSILTGVFATINATSLITGDIKQFGIQIVASIAIFVFSFIVSYILAVLVNKTIGLRVKEDKEYIGLDKTQHGEYI